MAKPNVVVTIVPTYGDSPLQVLATLVSVPTVTVIDPVAIAHYGITTSVKLADPNALAHIGYQFVTYEYTHFWKVKAQRFDTDKLNYTFNEAGTHYFYLHLIENGRTEYVYEYSVLVGIPDRDEDSPVDLILETDRQCHRFATKEDSGLGWSQFEGEAWIWPDTKASHISFFKDGVQTSIIYDRNSGFPFIVDSRKPEGLLKEVFKDKQNLLEDDSGYDIESSFLPAELTASNQSYFVKPSDLNVYFRETPDDFECNLELLVDNVEQADLENIPFDRILYFIDGLSKEGNSLRLHFYLNKSNYVFENYIWSLVRTIKSITDDVGLLEVEDVQYKWGNLIAWLTKFNYSRNRVNYYADELTLFDSTDGPDGEPDSAITSPAFDISKYSASESMFFWSNAPEENLFETVFDHDIVTWYYDETTGWSFYELKNWYYTYDIVFKDGYKCFDFRIIQRDTINQSDVDYMVDEVINKRTDTLWP